MLTSRVIYYCVYEHNKHPHSSLIHPLQDLAEWSGHVNWNTQYNVLKDSATTPVILVSNSSIQNGSTILNELLTKSPTHLTDILAIYLG